MKRGCDERAEEKGEVREEVSGRHPANDAQEAAIVRQKGKGSKGRE